MLNKERDTGTYRLSAYYLAKVLVEVPLMLVLPFIYSVITYWMVLLICQEFPPNQTEADHRL